MSVRVDPALAEEVGRFGAPRASECFNCGTCTAVCALSKDATVFPRKAIRYLQLGLRDDLRASAEPWLCYYCGDCSKTCPREADPGKLMMAVRRWLTAQYDWTGISRLLYLSKAGEVAALAAIGIAVVVLFAASGAFTAERMPLDHVSINTFAPVAWVHYGDWILAGLLTFFLLTNAICMHRRIMGKEKGLFVPELYVQQLKDFVVHAATQARWRECENRSRWIKHLLLVTGYGTMFVLVVLFLPFFQRDGAEFHPTSLLGYYATLVLFFYTVDAMIGRLKKKEELYKDSHHTDWMFLILLFAVSLSGILLHLFRMLDLPMPAYIAYVAHLAIAVPMLIVEVPFGKWAHLLYRPLAIYLVSVREKAKELAEAQAGAAAAAAAPAGKSAP